MLKNRVVIEDAPAAPPLNPDFLSKMKKEDMKQAIFERFSARSAAVAPRTAVRKGVRSPYWQSADEEC